MTDRVWPEVYKKLGVSPIINAQSWVTALGGSIMRPEVLSAMDEAANAFVDIKNLTAQLEKLLPLHVALSKV